MSYKRLLNHPLVVVISNLLLLMVLYSLCRIVYYWVNYDLYTDISIDRLWGMLKGGVRFDLTAILYLNSVYLILQLLPFHFRVLPTYQKVVKWFYLIPNWIGFFGTGVDMIYTRYSARRTTIQFFTEFANNNNLFSVFIKALTQFWYVTIFIIFIGGLIFLCYRPLKQEICKWKPIQYYVSQSILFCVSILLVVIGIRGGISEKKPLGNIDATLYIQKPDEINIVLNTPFTFLTSFDNTAGRVVNPDYFSQEELPSIMNPIHIVTDTVQFRKKNVVIFILESFSKEFIGYFNHDLDSGTYIGYTPFLDSLFEHSVTYRYSYATGRKSNDAVPSVVSSIPNLGVRLLSSSYYSTDATSSIADCLNSYGYNTAFFHGAYNGSMNFDAYSRNCGYKHYYGRTEYNNEADYDNYWGIWDEEFLQYMYRTMDTCTHPFVATVFTLSSHHPWLLPERYKEIFTRGTHPMHKVISYADYALRKFFESAKTQSWYDSTLFVFSADHTSTLSYKKYINAKGIFEIPIAFYSPCGDLEVGMRDQIISQIDIMPSILAYMGYPNTFFAFGEDALTKPKEHPYAINYNEPLYQIISDKLLIQYDGQKMTSIFDLPKDKFLEHNVLDSLKNTSEVQDMLRYLKGCIQQYDERMNSNRLKP